MLDTNICIFVIRQKPPIVVQRFIGPLDTMIAAHALRLRLPLVTNNTKEFARVSGLTLEDWST